jgi:hypothetical protein
MLVSMIDTGQSLNILQFVNRKNSLSLDKNSQVFDISQPMKVFGGPKEWLPSKPKNLRILIEKEVDISPTTINPKLLSAGYSGYFIVDAWYKILLNLLSWILSFVFGQLSSILQDKWLGRIFVKIFHNNFVVVVFFLTV